MLARRLTADALCLPCAPVVRLASLLALDALIAQALLGAKGGNSIFVNVLHVLEVSLSGRRHLFLVAVVARTIVDGLGEIQQARRRDVAHLAANGLDGHESQRGFALGATWQFWT